MSNFKNEEEKLELAKSLDITVEELDDLLKSAEADEDEDISKAKTEESTEDKEGTKEEEEDEEDEDKVDVDVEKSLKADIATKIAELKEIQKSKAPETNPNDELMKSFGEMKEDLVKSIADFKEEVTSIKTENEELKKSLGEIQETVSKIGENSQGTKGMRFGMSNVINKGLEMEEDGDKKYYASTDKRGLLKAMEGIMKSSKDDDLNKSVGDDIIQLESTGKLTQGALKRLNENQVYVKEQREQE